MLLTTCGDDVGGRIGNHPSVTVTSPLGGEVFVAGDPLVVTWTSQSVEGTVDIEYSTDGGITWKPLSLGEANDGVYAGTVPSDASAACLVRVSPVEGGRPDVCDAVFTILHNGPVWYVDIDAPAGGDGSSWDKAINHPQDAVDAATADAGHEVRIAQGLYKRRTGSDTVLLTMKDGVAIYGGYAGLGEADPDARDVALNVTTFDGETLVYHVVVGASNATLDGFTVTRGNATGAVPDNDGGGVYCTGVTGVVISSCTLAANSANNDGGGSKAALGSAVSFVNCVFSGNACVTDGAGLMASADAVLVNCTFTGNAASRYGGAISNAPSGTTTAENCVMWGNTASSGGNAIYVVGGSCTVAYSDIDQVGGFTDGGGNIKADPLFVDAADPDGPDDVWMTADDGLRLSPGSPCIDAADGDQAPATDILGSARHDDPAAADRGVGAVTYADMGAYEFQGSSAGTWTDTGQTLGNAMTGGVALGDLDGDGDIDLVAGNNNQMSAVWLNDGKGQFAGPVQTFGNGNTVAVALGDVDGDGDLDCVAGNISAQPNTVWTNDGAGLFTDSGQMLGGSDTQAVALGDVDGDGDLDLVTGNYFEQVNRVWINDGAGVFTAAGQSLGAGFTSSVALGDVDGDGDLDFVAGNYNQPNKVWENDGSGTFTDSGQTLGGNNTYCVAFGDVDGDGGLDLLEGNLDNQPNRIWLNNGVGGFELPLQALGTGFTAAAALGDLDGDGDLDFVAANAAGQPNRVWVNDGAGSFADLGEPLGSSSAYCVAVGDLDGDGDLDFVAGNWSEADRVWRNNSVVANIAPSAPGPLPEAVSGCDVALSWTASTDTETEDASLTYNLRVGTTAGGDEVSASHADSATGWRMIPAMGNANGNVSWTLKHLAAGTYFWSVQAVDAGLAGSTWAAEGSFAIDPRTRVWYVDCDVASSGDGRTWDTALKDLQEALAVAVDGDDIRVAQGTYTPHATDRAVSFAMVEGVNMYGGYAGAGEADPDARDVAAYVATLSGDINTPGLDTDNSYHVVVGASNARLDGFTVTLGNANGGAGDDTGGGMSNTAVTGLTIADCAFSANNAASAAGAMLNNSIASPTIERCTFDGNTAGYGAAMTNALSSSPNIRDCSFASNSSVNDAGALRNTDGSSPTVERCIFTLNTSTVGGVMHNSVCSPQFANCIFYQNTAATGGGAVNNSFASPTFTNCIFTANSAANGGAIRNSNGTSVLKNCILWLDTATVSGNEIDNDTGDSDASYCNIGQTGGFTDGGGNIDADPLFAAPADPDGPDDVWMTADDGLRLSPGSPCIDAADGTAPGFPEQDILGEERNDDPGTPDTGQPAANGNHPDMGAYEFAPLFTDTGQALGTSETYGLALGDIDGDADLDIVAGNFSGQANRVWTNDGAGAFTISAQALGGSDTFCLALGDVDGDGDLDCLAGNGTGQANRLWLNDGTGTFTDSGQALGSGNTSSVALGDVDGDGDLDCVEAIYNVANRVWLNDGSGTFTDSGQALGSSNTWSVALGDVDGDGDLDCLEGIDGANRVWLNDGTGAFTDSGQALGASDTYSVPLGDVDGDGDLDCVAGNWMAQANRVWLNDGTGTFTDSGQALGGNNTALVALGDADGDGDLDCLEGNTGVQANRLWLNDGSGTFTDSGQALGGSNTMSVSFGDVDGDGDLDCMAGNRSSQPNRVWRNNSPVANTPPGAPSGLSAGESGNAVSFSWLAASDTETAAASLSYNLRVGTTPGGNEVFAGHSDSATGWRMVPATGNAQMRLRWTLKGLAAGTYNWSVQAVDAGLAGSAWATGTPLTIYGYKIVELSTGIVTDAETVPDLLTNTEGPGGTNKYKTTHLVLKRVEAGTFTMGNEVDDAFADEEPEHTVNITQPFYMGVFELTQAQWEVIAGAKTFAFEGFDGRPAESVSWNDCQNYLTQLSAATGGTFRLPTEAEWEYSCKAGTSTDYSFGAGTTDPERDPYMWYVTNSAAETHDVGTKLPNLWGLYDMHGNVWEFCQDWYLDTYYPTSPTDDPPGPASGTDRTVRGGSWNHDGSLSRSTCRGYDLPASQRPEYGLRVVLDPTPRYKIVDLATGAIAGRAGVPDLETNTEGPSSMNKYKTTHMVLKRVEAGSFLMGDQSLPPIGLPEELPVHPVNITQDYYLGVFETTQYQWEQIMGSWSFDNANQDMHPAEMISWNDCQSYLGQVSTLTGATFRFPTEAEWEYACRAGTSTNYSYGDAADGDWMWHDGNSGAQSHEVGTTVKRPNPWGFYDMHGNLWEWCQDWYDAAYYQYCVDNTITDDPQGPATGTGKVLHGGPWDGSVDKCRSASRRENGASDRLNTRGCRVVLEP